MEIKRAEPRDGSGKMGTGGGGMGGGGMNAPGDQPAAGQWGPPAPAINIMQGHNGQMGGPPINMPMAGPNIMQGWVSCSFPTDRVSAVNTSLNITGAMYEEQYKQRKS